MIDYCDLSFRFIDWFSYYFDLLIDLYSNRLLWWLFRLVCLTFSGLMATYNKLVLPKSRFRQHVMAIKLLSVITIVNVSNIVQKVNHHCTYHRERMSCESESGVWHTVNCKWFQSPRPHVSYFLLVISGIEGEKWT